MPALQLQPRPASASPDEESQPRHLLRVHFRRFHRWVGGLAALFVVLLAATGILLNHPALTGGPSLRTTAIAINPRDPAHILKATPSGLFLSEDGGGMWEEIPADAADATDVVFAQGRPARAYASLRDFGLIRSDDGGRVWEPVPLPFVPAAEGISILRVSPGPGDAVALLTSAGLLYTPDLGKTWSWRERHPEDLRAIVHQIHTGYFFSRYAFYLYDLAACALIALTVTGLVIWGRKNGHAKNRG